MRYNKLYLVGEQLKPMTLIIGARCKDGVIIIADKKITEGNTSIEQNKITILPFGVAISGAGYTDFFDKFNIKLNNYLTERDSNIAQLKAKKEIPQDAPIYNYIDEFITDCETLIVKLREDYREVKPQLHILLSIRNNNISELHFINMDTGVDSIRKTFMTIGSGSPYANFFLRELWKQDLTMDEMANIGAFIINYVAEKKLDEAVGYGFQIVKIPDLIPNMKEGEGNIIETTLTDKNKIEKCINDFHTKVKDLKKEII